MENPETQDMDNDSQDDFQDENIFQELIRENRMLKTSHRRQRQ